MLDKIKNNITEPLLNEGIRVLSVTLEKEGKDNKIVVTIDKDEPVSIDDCVKATKIINPILDEIDPLEGNYLLEVGSKGVDEDGE